MVIFLLFLFPKASFGQSTETRVELQVEAAHRVIRAEGSGRVVLIHPEVAWSPDSIVVLARLRLAFEGISDYRGPGIPDTTIALLHLGGVGGGPGRVEAVASLTFFLDRGSQSGRELIPTWTNTRVFGVNCPGDDCIFEDQVIVEHGFGYISLKCADSYFELTDEERRECKGDRPPPAGQWLGCYQVDWAGWDDWSREGEDSTQFQLPEVLQLLPTTQTGPEGLTVKPSIMSYEPARGRWTTPGPDSLSILWTNGFTGIQMKIGRVADSLIGAATAFTDNGPMFISSARVVMTPTNCDRLKGGDDP